MPLILSRLPIPELGGSAATAWMRQATWWRLTSKQARLRSSLIHMSDLNAGSQQLTIHLCKLADVMVGRLHSKGFWCRRKGLVSKASRNSQHVHAFAIVSHYWRCTHAQSRYGLRV